MTAPVGSVSDWYPEELESPVIFNSAGHYTWTAPTPPSGKKLSSVWAVVGAPGGIGVKKQWLDVSPGETLHIYAGGCPSGSSGGYNGGGAAYSGYVPPQIAGGYGASDIRQGGSGLGNRILVAGGLGGYGIRSLDGGSYGFDYNFPGSGYGIFERYKRWYPGGNQGLAPDDSNVIIDTVAGTAGQGADGSSAGGAVSFNLEWPSGEAHYDWDGVHAVTTDHTVTVWAGAGGGGYVGGSSGYITYLDKGNIGPWLPPNYYTAPDGDTDTDPPNPAPPAYWTPNEYDEFGTLITPGYWTYPYGNPRSEPWPVTEEAELTASQVMSWYGYASYIQMYTASAGTRGTDYNPYADVPGWGGAIAPEGADALWAVLYSNGGHEWTLDGVVMLMYGFMSTGFAGWSTGSVRVGPELGW